MLTFLELVGTKDLARPRVSCCVGGPASHSSSHPAATHLTVECCTTPSLSIMNRPRREMPSAVSTPYACEISFFRSATKG
jgi:hypothetical protein